MSEGLLRVISVLVRERGGEVRFSKDEADKPFTLEIAVDPDDEDGYLVRSAEVSAEEAAAKEAEDSTSVTLKRPDGQVVVVELDPDQLALVFDDEEDGDDDE